MGRGSTLFSGVPVATLLIALLFCASVCDAQEGRYEDRYSFKAPFPMVRGSYLASWEFSGSTVVTEEYVRLTPAIKSRTGSIWNVQPVTFHDWEVVIEFRIGGGGKLGADGLAFWYTAERYQGHDGPVFGSKDKWNGLGIFFDTFDNDGMRDNPQITIVLNEGTAEWREDGKHLQIGGCHAQFRNPYRNVKVKVRHVQDLLDVHIDTGTNSWEPCATALAVASLPTNYYFGMTAATGGLFDNHDVYAFETYNLDNSPQQYNEQVPVQEKPAEQQWQQQPTEPQQQQQQQQQQQPAAGQKDERFGDILNKLNNIGQDNAQQQPTQQVQQQQQQQQQPTQQQPLQQQQQQQQPTQPQQPPQQQQYTADSATLKEILKSVGDLNTKVETLSTHQQQQKQNNENSDTNKLLEQVIAQQKVIAEAFAGLLQTVALKTEMTEMQTQAQNHYNTFVKELADTRSLLTDIKATVNTKVSTRNEDIIRTLEDVSQNVNQLKKGVEQTKESTKQIAGSMQQSQQDLTNTIERQTGFGFWTYFMFVQAIFIFGFVWWKKHRDDANKKLL